MEILDSSFIYRFISQFLFPMVQTLILFMILLLVIDPKYYFIKSILRKENKYVLHKKIYIPNYITPYGKTILFIYDKVTNYPLYTLFVFIIFSIIIDRINLEIYRFLPPYISFRTVLSQLDYDTVSKIWYHYPEITDYYEFSNKLISLRNSQDIDWQKSPIILSSHLYIKIQAFCRFSLILIIITGLLSKSYSKIKKFFRIFIMSFFIIAIYSISVFLSIKSYTYDQNQRDKQILNYLDEQEAIVYQTEELENYINTIDAYNSEIPKYNIRFK